MTHTSDDILEYLPADIQRLFDDAEIVRSIGSHGAAASISQYRSILDKTMTALAHDAGIISNDKNGKEMSRYAQIECLSETDLLPKNVRDWIGSNGIRNILNAASHGDRMTVEQASEIAEITRFILIYIFVLPKRVEQARATFLKKECS